MKVKIEINCDNAAFDEYPEQEVNRILQKLIHQQANGPLEYRTLKDLNGNTVGFITVEGDES